jgi:hypothetical protein
MEKMPITMLSGLGCGGDCGCSCNNNKPLNGMRSARSLMGLGATDAPPIIYWNTEPDTSADGRKVSWSCNDWMEWHKKLAAKYGTQRANEVSQQWWDKLSWYDTKKLTCFANCSFYNYFKKAGGGWSSLIPELFCTIDQSGGKLVENAGKVVDSAGNVIANAADAAENTTSTLKWLIPTAVVGVVGLVGYYLYKNYAKGNARVKVGKQTI